MIEGCRQSVGCTEACVVAAATACGCSCQRDCAVVALLTAKEAWCQARIQNVELAAHACQQQQQRCAAQHAFVLSGLWVQ
jgi:hypothetical protein